MSYGDDLNIVARTERATEEIFLITEASTRMELCINQLKTKDKALEKAY